MSRSALENPRIKSCCLASCSILFDHTWDTVFSINIPVSPLCCSCSLSTLTLLSTHLRDRPRLCLFASFCLLESFSFDLKNPITIPHALLRIYCVWETTRSAALRFTHNNKEEEILNLSFVELPLLRSNLYWRRIPFTATSSSMFETRKRQALNISSSSSLYDITYWGCPFAHSSSSRVECWNVPVFSSSSSSPSYHHHHHVYPSQIHP